MPVLDDLKKIRESRKLSALMEYQQTVETIAAGDADPAEFGVGLDDIMLRLSLSDTVLAADVGVLRDLRAYRQRVADFDAKRSEHDERLTKAQAKLAKLNKEYRTFRQRHDEAQQAVRDAGTPIVRARKARTKIDKIERNNPRLFDSAWWLENEDG